MSSWCFPSSSFRFRSGNMATVTLPKRDPSGRYAKKNAVRKKRIRSSIQIEHNYCVGSVCDGNECRDDLCAMHPPLKSKNIRADGWKFGRRVVELDVLLSSLKYCRACRLGPVPLTYYNIVGEKKRGLGGYIYVKCQNVDCGEINCVPPQPPNLTEWVGPGNAGEMHQDVVFVSSPHFLCAKKAGIRAFWDKIQQCRVKYQRFCLLFSLQSMLLQVLVFYGPSTLVMSFQAWSVILSTLFLGKPPTQLDQWNHIQITLERGLWIIYR